MISTCSVSSLIAHIAQNGADHKDTEGCRQSDDDWTLDVYNSALRETTQPWRAGITIRLRLGVYSIDN